MIARPRTLSRFLLFAIVGLLALVAAACGADSGTDTATDDDSAAESSESETTEAAQDDADGAGAADATPAASRCDLDFNTVGYYEEAELVGVNDEAAEDEGHSHAGDGHEGMTDEEHAAMDPDEGEDGVEAPTSGIVDHGDHSEEEHEQWLLDHADGSGFMNNSDSPDDTGHGGHTGPQPWAPMTDEQTCEQLNADLEQARQVALQYPTAVEAKAAGYVLITPYVPGIASHWMNFAYVDDTFEIDKPEMLLFDGNLDTSQIAGLSYYILDARGTVEPTDGFTGENDHYHRHLGLCISIERGQVIGPESLSEEQCAAMGGFKEDGSSGWMSHAWVVPGCESPWGVFSGENPILTENLAYNSGQEGNTFCSQTGIDYFDNTPGLPEGTDPGSS